MSPVLAGHYSVHALAFIRTILPQSEPPITMFPNKLFISVIKWEIQALVRRYSVHATASLRVILSLPEPTPLILIPPVLCIRFQHATQPLLHGVQTREASVCKTRPYTRQWLCGTARVSSLRVCMYSPVY